MRKVSYKVDPTRVGQQTDFDKLSMRVETNGAITPEEIALMKTLRHAMDPQGILNPGKIFEG